MRRLTFAVCLVSAALCAVADERPGTFFNPLDGNAVSAVTNTQAAVRRTIAFLGGSITEMNGFRPRVMKALRAKYPGIAFTEFAAGLSSTCSDTGAFRLRRDLLSQCVPDLLIVDEAVNDDQDGHFGREHAIRGVEGIVRQALAVNPRCRIVLALMVNEGQYAELMKGEVPLQYAAERDVARHYGLAVADVGSALADSARSGGMSWTEYKDCHPSPVGCDLGAKVVMDAISSVFDPFVESEPQALPEPMDAMSYFNAYEVPLESVSGGSAWTVSKLDWSVISGEKRSYFAHGDVLWCETTNVDATVAFNGTAVGFTLTAGPDAGDLEVAVDDGDFATVRLRANYGRLHYPYTIMVADDLKPGRHTVRFRVVAAMRGNRTGTTVRINRICANGERTLTERIAARCKVQMTDEWCGFPRTVFLFRGHQAWVVEPRGAPLPGNPWTWTLQWWGAFVPRTAVPQMLSEGYHHAVIDGFEFRGTDAGIRLFEDFQRFLVADLGLAPKTRLIGMSWGGFMSVRYAAACPQNVEKVFLDCPLMNFDGFGAEGAWGKEGKRNGEWSDDPRMPVNLAEPIARAGIPVLLRYGGQDQTVLPRLNCELFIPRFKAAGGKIEVVKDGLYGHHPHGFEVGSSKLPSFFR